MPASPLAPFPLPSRNRLCVRALRTFISSPPGMLSAPPARAAAAALSPAARPACSRSAAVPCSSGSAGLCSSSSDAYLMPSSPGNWGARVLHDSGWMRQ